ncbi:hypothetical protein TNCV_2882311 [Trichonephila clavipes]|nr:hypothetical protein TNCV_2882311 [Trichonephila clavipes]
MANYSGCPKFPKPRKGTQEKTNTYTNTVNSTVRPGTSYLQAASTSNLTTDGTTSQGNSCCFSNKPGQSIYLTDPPTINFNNNGTFDMNFITQTLQQTILALSMLTQHIGNVASIPPPLPPIKSKKAKNREQRKKELHAIFEALIDFDDD